MKEKSLQMALDFMGIKKLPREGEHSPTGMSIAEVVKDTGKSCYVITRYDMNRKKPYIVKDFLPGSGNMSKMVALYPVKEKKQDEPAESFNFYALSADEMRAWLDERNIPYSENKKAAYIKAYDAAKK